MFKKQFFPEATVKALATNQTIFEKGKSLIEEHQVKEISLNEGNRSVEFTIQDVEEHKTYLSFLENGLAQKYSCSCTVFQRQSGACQHVIASMLYLNTINQESFDVLGTNHIITNEQPSSKLQLLQKNRAVLSHLFESAKKDIESQSISFSKTPLQFEFVLNMHKVSQSFEYELYLKVGVDHLYVINDIVEVIEYLLKGNEYTFGKQLIYNPKDYSILPEDRKIINYIYEVGKTQEETFDLVYGGRTPEKNGALNIPPKYVPELLKLLTEVDGGFVRQAPRPRLLSTINQLEAPEVEHETKLPITFNIVQEKDHYVLDVSEEDKKKKVTVHPQANMVSVNNFFYLLEPGDFKVAQLLIDTINDMTSQPLQLTKDDLTSFYSLVLPNLKNIFHYEIEEGIEENIERVPLEPKLFIDFDGDSLLIEPTFKYGENALNPLISKTEEKTEVKNVSGNTSIFVRDVINENDVLNVLSHFFRQAKVIDGKYVLSRFEDISEFIYDTLVEVSELMDIFLTNEVKNLMYDEDIEPSFSIEMNKSTNLLDIRFDLADISNDDLPQLVTQLQNTDERFFKLDSGKIVDLKENRFVNFFDNINKLELEASEISKETSVSVLRGLTLVEEDSVLIGEQFKKFIRELKEPENLSFELPEGLVATLRPYQETGFNWLSTMDYYGLGGVLADDMGLGKTIQTIAFLVSKIEKVGGKYLVVSPSSVVYNWEKEFDKFAPSVKTSVISGSIEEREIQLNEALNNDEIDVLITSYPLIQRDIQFYKKHVFKTIVLDESQNVKNDLAKTTKAVKELRANNTFALSGTPIENNLNELWSLFSIVLPGLFRSKKSFNNLTENEIARKIEIFILRRLKVDVLDDLPPKTETVEFIELSDEQKRLYQTQLSLIRNDVEELIEQDEFEQNRMRILAGMTRLRQICCDPRLINPEYDGGSAKLERLLEYLREALTNNKRVVLFSQFTSMLSIIREILDEQSVDYHYLDGGTPKEDRLELTTRFNDGEKDLFLISLRAGGTGLNLTGGDTVILYDSWWNPAIEDQAADRVHRFGQKKSVQVIRMIMKGTIEEGINELQDQKRELIDTVIRKNDNKKTTTLTKDDILALLTNG